MSLKSTALSVLLSIAAGVLVFFLFTKLAPEGASSSEPLPGTVCSVLIVDETQNDNYVQETLSSHGLLGFDSESSQFVALDDFGSLKFIPLDSFYDEIEAFDPRNDGYAARLRSFFVHDGKRFFYSLLESNVKNPYWKMKKNLDEILTDIPFTLVVLGQKQSNFLHLFLLFPACTMALFFSQSRRLFIFQFPLLLVLGYFGFFSFLLAALLAGIWELLREPLGEIFAAARYERRKNDYAGAGFKGIRERLKPYRINLLFAFIFAMLFIIFSLFGVFPLLLLPVVLVSFFFLYFVSLKTEGARVRKNSHMLFTPVLLLPQKAKTFSFFPFLLPYGFVSILALFLSLVLPGLGFNTVNSSPAAAHIAPEYLISREEYSRHLAFQQSFSYSSLNQDSQGQKALNQKEYLRYHLGKDGLIEASASSAFAADEELKLEPELTFPLEKLMDFLINYNKLALGESVDRKKLFGSQMAAGHKEWISVAVLLAICLLDFIGPIVVLKKKTPAIGAKRIPA